MTNTDTDEIVYGMMTENTGIHMMDSGGGSGRAWQRNQKFSIEDFIKSPRANLDWGASINIFHFFCEFLEHDPKVQAEIEEVAERLPDESWFGIREAFIEQKQTEGWTFHNTYNTYNDPDSIHLSQVFEGSEMEDENGDPLLVVMLHNGADVRGGYTKPYAFRYTGNCTDDFWSGMMDYELFCTDHDCDFSLSVRGLDTFDRDGNYVPDAILWEHVSEKTCPKCNKQTLDIDVNW